MDFDPSLFLGPDTNGHSKMTPEERYSLTIMHYTILSIVSIVIAYFMDSFWVNILVGISILLFITITIQTRNEIYNKKKEDFDEDD